MSSKQKILIVHRPYRTRGGEDVFLHEVLIPRLKKLNIAFDLYAPSRFGFFEILFMVLGLEVLRPSYRELRGILSQGRYHSLLFNNFIPGISLKVAKLAQKEGLRTYAWLHNMRFTCANGLYFNGKTHCQLCSIKGSRFAFLQNCHKNFFQSMIYSIVYRFGRIKKIVTPHIDVFICNSNFTKGNFLKFNPALSNRTRVIPMPPPNIAQPKEVIGIPFPYFLYIGRLSYEKGADRIFELSKEHPQMNFVLLGAKAPVNSTKKFFPPKKYPNLILKTESTPEEKAWLIKNAAAVLVPSRVQETYSLVVVEAAQHGTPVLVPAGGGAEETFKNWHGNGQAFKEFKSPEINLNAWIISQRKSTRKAKDLHPLDLKFEEAILGLWQPKQKDTIGAEI